VLGRHETVTGKIARIYKTACNNDFVKTSSSLTRSFSFISALLVLLGVFVACSKTDFGDPDPASDASAVEDVQIIPVKDGGRDGTMSMPSEAGPDSGPKMPDAAMTDAKPDVAVPMNASAQIAAARATADGIGLALKIDGATVTYLKPALGNPINDPAGFTIQAAQLGPALFIAVDPKALTPAPAVGDVVTLTVTGMATTGGLRLANALTGYVRTSTGGSVASLVQTLSASTDVVSMLGNYESELVTVSGTIAAPFVSSGAMFEQAQITTAGITGDANYRLRMPQTLRDTLELTQGCTFTVQNIPVGRFGAAVQYGTYEATDITAVACPAPSVVSAVAVSQTSVAVTFSRRMDPATLLADASQFGFDKGLVATSATLSDRTVTLSTTPQTVGETYTVTAATTLTDLAGMALATPTSALFKAYETLATVRINEVNANIAGGCDLIELRVTSGGSMNGFKLLERDTQTLIANFAGLIVPTNAIIVVHMGGALAACNPNTATSELTGPSEQPSASFARNYDTAYDFWSADAGITSTDNVITLYSGAGTIVDAVFLDDDIAGNNVAAATEAQAAIVAAAMQWQMVGGGAPAGGYINDAFRINAARDLDATGSSASGTSIQRNSDADNNDQNDWTQTASSFGTLNAGQTAL
jgi:Bacterial Ig-like domain